MDDPEVYWCGSKLSHVSPLSRTKGELIKWMPQRRRPFADQYIDPDDEDAFGLLLEKEPAGSFSPVRVVTMPSSPA